MRFASYKEEFLLPWECIKIPIGVRNSKVDLILELKKWLITVKENKNDDHGNRRGNEKVGIYLLTDFRAGNF